MSREIEFRVYDKEKNMWTNFKILDNTIFFMDKNTGVWFHEKYKAKERFSLMQYTGIKDKNGVEIYEGDIVLIRIDKTNILHKTVVKFKHGAFIADIIGNNDYIYLFHFGFNKDDFEVIGNIYENEKLLKSEERKND
jgi:hypothetical protein|nr:MAG TPA: YopX protein [Caudoviricetes sp.]